MPTRGNSSEDTCCEGLEGKEMIVQKERRRSGVKCESVYSRPTFVGF